MTLSGWAIFGIILTIMIVVISVIALLCIAFGLTNKLIELYANWSKNIEWLPKYQFTETKKVWRPSKKRISQRSPQFSTFETDKENNLRNTTSQSPEPITSSTPINIVINVEEKKKTPTKTAPQSQPKHQVLVPSKSPSKSEVKLPPSKSQTKLMVPKCEVTLTSKCVNKSRSDSQVKIPGKLEAKSTGIQTISLSSCRESKLLVGHSPKKQEIKHCSSEQSIDLSPPNGMKKKDKKSKSLVVQRQGTLEFVFGRQPSLIPEPGQTFTDIQKSF